MRKSHMTAVLPLTVLCAAFTAGCSAKQPYRHDSFTFDTLVSITIYDVNGNSTAEEICKGASGMLSALDDTLSRTKSDSLITRINDNAYSSAVDVDAATYNMLKTCTQLSDLTDGAFDITLGNISDMWGFGKENAVKPDDAELKKLAGRKNYENIVFNYYEQTVAFSSDGFSIDLGAAAKGYAMDMMDTYLRDSGVTSAVVDFGGSILTIGDNNGERWNITITADETNSPVGTLKANEGYIATSNGAKRFVEYDGVKYHHIIDPETAYPADSGVKSCTVYSGSGLISDALSTAFFVMGADKAKEFYDKYDIAEYIITLTDGTVIVSDGISADFTAS